MNPELELALYRFQNQLGSRLAGAREVEDVLRSALRAVQEFFAASDACLAVLFEAAVAGLGRPAALARDRVGGRASRRH